MRGCRWTGRVSPLHKWLSSGPLSASRGAERPGPGSPARPAGADDALARLEGPILLCADESCRTVADLDRLEGNRAITIKLDNAGGLTEALALAEAKRRGLRIMVGGGVGTSLGVAPALLVAQRAEIVDLDGPLHLAADRVPGLRYDGGTIRPSDPKLWGGAG